jgi:hypothetical protein
MKEFIGGKFLSSARPDSHTQCKTTVDVAPVAVNCCHTLHQSVIIPPPLFPLPPMWPLRHHPRYVILNNISTNEDQDQRSTTIPPLEPDSSVSRAKKLL